MNKKMKVLDIAPNVDIGYILDTTFMVDKLSNFKNF